MIIKRGPFEIEIRKAIRTYSVSIYYDRDSISYRHYSTQSNALRGAKRAVVRLYSNLLNIHADILRKEWK